MATARPFVVSASLTAIAIAYRNQAYQLIADRLMPRRPVGSERFKWTEYDIAQGFTVPDARVGRKGRVQEVEFSGTERDASTEDYAFDAPIPNSDVNEARRQRELGLSNYDPEQVAAEFLTDYLILAREVRVAAVVQNPSNYAPANQINIAVAGDRFDSDTSDPFAVLDQALDNMLGPRANVIGMGQPVWTWVKKHPRLIKAVKGGLTDEGAITRQQLADLLEVREVVVGESRINAARPGQAVNLQRTWGKTLFGLFVNPAATAEMGMTWGLTAEVGTRLAGMIEDPNIGMEGGRRTRVGEKVRELVLSKQCGFLIQNAVS